MFVGEAEWKGEHTTAPYTHQKRIDETETSKALSSRCANASWTRSTTSALISSSVQMWSEKKKQKENKPKQKKKKALNYVNRAIFTFGFIMITPNM